MNKPLLFLLAALTSIAVYSKLPSEKYSDFYLTKNKVNADLIVRLITEGKDSTITLTQGNHMLFYTNKRGGIFNHKYRNQLVDEVVSIDNSNPNKPLGEKFYRTSELEPLFVGIDKDYRKYVNFVKAKINGNEFLTQEVDQTNDSKLNLEATVNLNKF
jgi:hypothetical protein